MMPWQAGAAAERSVPAQKFAPAGRGQVCQDRHLPAHGNYCAGTQRSSAAPACREEVVPLDYQNKPLMVLYTKNCQLSTSTLWVLQRAQVVACTKKFSAWSVSRWSRQPKPQSILQKTSDMHQLQPNFSGSGSSRRASCVLLRPWHCRGNDRVERLLGLEGTLAWCFSRSQTLPATSACPKAFAITWRRGCCTSCTTGSPIWQRPSCLRGHTHTHTPTHTADVVSQPRGTHSSMRRC